MSNQEKKELLDVFKKGPWKTLVFLFLIILVFGLFKPWVQIGAGERGIVLNFGAVQDKGIE
jgi:regulator of protease activity HflC (stomatin/prohibitin superfamily)